MVVQIPNQIGELIGLIGRLKAPQPHWADGTTATWEHPTTNHRLEK